MEYGAPILKFQKDLPDFFPSHWVVSYADGEYRIQNPTLVKTRIPHQQGKMSHPQPCPVDVLHGRLNFSNPAQQVMS